MDAAVKDVLAEHRFAPATVLPGAGGATYMVAARSDARQFLEMVVVRISRDNRVKVEIHAFQYVSSDWATAGPLFTKDRSHKEALAMEQAIEKKLEGREHTLNKFGGTRRREVTAFNIERRSGRALYRPPSFPVAITGLRRSVG